ncbi:2-isopropylmalate synthase [Verrucomicrobium sp. GAS474]|uniref:2-isopropylmalate synthase n=1 Tax=Verrucomicrobium sp. GAS474 TaxID=1882831 RepID=UPI00087B49EC|nr:2-isopropylmalate synthase [Verrucomicrobium sp. GAS474]SDU02430.1 2-isopropylmalate synthase [Verrucomicrobium sp. GAS474]
MIPVPSAKYRPMQPVVMPFDMSGRQWPSRQLTAAPRWCSVDLRDGNQALAVPMNIEQKLEMFDALVKIGFKEIEVGFPSASETEYNFMRRLIEEGRIPDDVAIQVLVQAREDLIERTVESLKGAKKAIIHLYNSTSPAQRRIVFGLEKAEIVNIAVRGTKWIQDRVKAGRLPGTEVTFQYSPESFSATEVDFALEVCEAVVAQWQPTPQAKMILNLPDTVEVAMPNVYADQIEWFLTHVKNRESIVLSLHTHNDRGTGVAATELALLAGADRVEGTLFGNGERTGNLDIVIVALNLYTQGVAPGLDFSDLNGIRAMYEKVTKMEVPPRQPYGGDLVFTAFSGSHQDAINKGMKLQKEAAFKGQWDVPYLTIDPKDIGREYGEIIRINSQSGKGGVAWVLETEYGLALPKPMHKEFGPLANDHADKLGREISAEEIHALFNEVYVTQPGAKYHLIEFHSESDRLKPPTARGEAILNVDGEGVTVRGTGNGPIAAFVAAISPLVGPFEVIHYSEHALGTGAKAEAIAYIQLKFPDGKTVFGAGRNTSIETASIGAVVSALNRAGKK